MTEFTWLHLTDLHMGVEGSDHLWPAVQEEFFNDLSFLFEKVRSLDLVLFTGDLTQSADPHQFDAVEGLLGELWKWLGKRKLNPKLCALPGNHDLLRKDPPDAATQWLTSNFENDAMLRKTVWEQPGSEYRKALDLAFANYAEWWNKTKVPKVRPRPGVLAGDFTTTIEKNGTRLGILALNSAFLQLKGGDLKGKLAIDVRQFDAAAGGNRTAWLKAHDLCLLLTHHPPDWLTRRAQDVLAGDICVTPERFALHLFGHMHETGLLARGEGLGTRHEFQGCSLFSAEKWDEAGTPRVHGYSLGQLIVEDSGASIRIWPRKAERKRDAGWTLERESGLLDRGQDCTRPMPVRLWSTRPVQVRHMTAKAPAPAAPATEAPPPAPPAVPGLPAPFYVGPRQRSTAFLGRAEIKRQLERRLRQSGMRKVALYGPKGIGKSDLALDVAESLARANAFPGGIYVADLRREEISVESHRDARVRENLFAFGKAMGVLDAPRTPLDQGFTNQFIREQIRARLEQKATAALFIIDDSPGPEQTSEFTFGGSGSVYLLITRSERDAREFAGSENALRVRHFRTGEAVELLCSVAPGCASEDRRSLEGLADWLDDDPYTISCLGNWLSAETALGRSHTVAELSSTLAKEAVAVAARVVPDSKRVREGTLTRGLAGVLALLEGSLSAEARKTFRTLCLFPPPPSTFSLDAAAYLLGGDSKELDTLIKACLLHPAGVATGFLQSPRYTIDAAPGLYGCQAAAASAPEAYEAAQRCLVEYFTGLAQSRAVNRTSLDRERRNIEEAILTAIALGMPEPAIALVQSVTPFLVAEGLFESARNLLERAREAARSAGLGQKEAEILLGLGKLALACGSYAEAQEAFQAGLRIAGIGTACRIDLLGQLGWARDRNADNAGAIASLEEAAIACEQIDDPLRRCDVLKALGWAHAHHGDFEEARRHWSAGFKEANRASFDCWEEQVCYLGVYLGWVEDRLGEVASANSLFEEALPVASRVGSKPWCVAMTNMGAAAIHRGDYTHAEEYLKAGLDMALRAATPNEVSILYENLGIVATRRGDDRQAELALSSGLRYGARSGDPERTAAILTYLAELRLWQAGEEESPELRACRVADAERYLLVALDQGRRASNPERIAMSLLWSVRLATGLQKLPEAERERISASLAGGMSRLSDAEHHLEEALATANRLRYLWLQLALLLARGDFHLTIGAVDRAREDFVSVLNKAKSTGLAELLGLALLGSARAELDKDKRLALLAEAKARLEAVGHRAARCVQASI